MHTNGRRDQLARAVFIVETLALLLLVPARAHGQQTDAAIGWTAVDTALARAVIHESGPDAPPLVARKLAPPLLPILADARSSAPGVLRATSPVCTYVACALGIAPRWNGLAVVRGAGGPTVANLNFFWPRDLSGTLRGNSADAPGADSAAASAHRAVRLRRVGAMLTDVGAGTTAVAAIRAVRSGHLGRGEGVMATLGAIALGVSVPFQFAADGALSRAVWWHNVRFAR